MKPVNHIVNGKTVKLDDIQYPIYDNLSEAIDALGEAKSLDLINAQNCTNICNKARAELRPGEPSLSALKNLALTRIQPNEWATIAGDGAAIDAMIRKYSEQIKAERAAQRGTGAEEEDATTEPVAA